MFEKLIAWSKNKYVRLNHYIPKKYVNLDRTKFVYISENFRVNIMTTTPFISWVNITTDDEVLL
jgi:hypothetical protein